MTEREAWVAFSCFIPIGTQRFSLIRKYFGSARKAWGVPISKYLEIGFSDNLSAKFEDFRSKFDLGSYLNKLTAANIDVITSEEKDYPKRLKDTDTCPFVLYVRKRKNAQLSLSSLADASIAVVGARRMTAYGKEVTERIVSGLVRAGVTVVSGLALGIDAVAHRVAVEEGGLTIGVLGGGLDQIYPPANRMLGERIIKEGRGALISEYPLGYPARPENFPNRNRIVSGLSRGVLVIEGAEKSGTLITASTAAAQGRDVFAVPGSITSPMSKAPNYLIKNGARLVESAEDILEELGLKNVKEKREALKVLPETEEEKVLLEIIGETGGGVDSLVRISGMDTGLVLGTLTGMELKGMVKNVGGEYIKL